MIVTARRPPAESETSGPGAGMRKDRASARGRSHPGEKGAQEGSPMEATRISSEHRKQTPAQALKTSSSSSSPLPRCLPKTTFNTAWGMEA